jgi:hypothetical protein
VKKRAKKPVAPSEPEEVTRALAARWMVRADGICMGCGRLFHVPAAGVDTVAAILSVLMDPHEHPSVCPWARARKWAAENPA